MNPPLLAPLLLSGCAVLAGCGSWHGLPDKTLRQICGDKKAVVTRNSTGPGYYNVECVEVSKK